ncbi:hypothetical protein DL240_00565 [Lujinxingia litoralis]|uniref:Uncharacterized protein n=2 Tax=Lujinxingia litoralis TaxID=2211119 RepID=A0A328CAQ9_9DELT|nr:hypothetical protein DL240_00565 [Lujinxingia litoralis]
MGLGLMGCSTNDIASRIVGSAMQTTEQRIGEEIGNRVSGALLKELTPALMRQYTVGLMQMLFYQGGYAMEFAEYNPGEYTAWYTEGSEYGQEVVKAFLQRDEEGREWWRIESRAGADENGEEVVLVIEALFEVGEDGNRYVRRVRAQYPGETEVQEVPVQEEDAELWVIPSQGQLTEESLEGFKAGQESIETPAGSFNTARYEMKEQGTDDTMIWWITDEGVPGGLVATEWREDAEDIQQRMVLTAYGADATESKLGAF